MLDTLKYKVNVKDMRWYCPDEFKFSSTADIPEPSKLEDIIKGQEHAKRQLKNAIRLKQNAILLGPPGCGKSLLANKLAEQYSSEKSFDIELVDQLLAHNFDNEFEPLAISLPRGMGKELRNDLNALVKNLPKELAAYTGGEEKEWVTGLFNMNGKDYPVEVPLKKDLLLDALKYEEKNLRKKLEEVRKFPDRYFFERKLTLEDFLDNIEEVFGGRSMHPYIPQGMSKEKLIKRYEDKIRGVEEKIKGLEYDKKERKRSNYFDYLKNKYAKYDKVSKLLNNIIKDAIDNKDKILGRGMGLFGGGSVVEVGKGDSSEAYKVNLIVDNSETKGMPVQYIENPSLQNMIGDIQHDPLGLGGRKPHMRAKAGKLPQANDGIAIIDELVTVFRDEGLRDYLLTCLEEKKVRIGGGRGLYGGGTSAGIETEPVEADCIIIGCANIDIRQFTTEKMARRFKHKIMFDASMSNTKENREAYASFVAHEIREFNKDEKNKTKLPHFSPEALAQLCEYGARFATRLENKNGRDYITNILDPMKDIVMQAGLIAIDKNSISVKKEHILDAIKEITSSALKEQKEYIDKIKEGTINLKTDGEEIGYVNGLVVVPDPFGTDYFGVPARLEATIYAGEGGLISIPKESKLSGEVFTKSHEVIIGYFKQRYEKEKSARYEGRLDFNQEYNRLDGDSASIATVLAFTSALSDIPTKQYIAVTGSMNQHGDVQPVGGVNDKIEGFWKVCKQKGEGLTGKQGVIIPKSNVQSLMLNEELIEDVKNKKFHIYAIEHIDEAIEIAMGKSAEEVNKKIDDIIEKRYRPESLKDLLKKYR